VPAPLSSLVVVDLTRLLPGGFCTLLLADFGADVIKVEDTGAGDYARWIGERVEDATDPSVATPAFVALNRNKRSVQLDLKSEHGRAALLRLVATADVLVESFRPGVMERLRLGYEDLRAVNPRLVYCSITGYGQQGPLSHRAGHDMNYLATAGVLGLGGDAGGPLPQSPVQIADIGGGALMAAFAIMAALNERVRSGEGQQLDISMAHGALSWLALPAAELLNTAGESRRGELLLGGGAVCYRPYECADGWVSMAALEPKFWAAWCRGVGREDLIPHQFDPPGSDAHHDVAAVLAARTRDEWALFGAEHDCCLEPVAGLGEALESPLVTERGMVVELDQPGVDRPLRVLGQPIGMSRTPADERRSPAPSIGEHTYEVLNGLGYSPSEIESLLDSGAASGSSPDRRQPT
jgi:alpha-methylacyl-CoA racemase